MMKLEKESGTLHEQVEEIIHGPDDLFLKDGFPEFLSGLSRQLLAGGKQPLIDALIDRVMSALDSDVQNIRDQAATAVVEIITAFPADRQLEQIRRIAGPVTEWIRRETTASRAYRKICSWQKELVQEQILKGAFADVIPILEVFNRIHAGLLDNNNDTIDSIAADIIRELASGESLTILFGEFDNNRQNKQLEAGRVLVRLGDVPLNRLMDRLRDVEDTDERVRVLQVIADLGPMAIPAVRERIQSDEPWYYLRNLAYLLGKVGTEESAYVLQPLLLHKNSRVQAEALKSLRRTGGKEGGSLMMSILPVVDDDFKLDIIEMLGLMKYAPAAPMLLDLLVQRPLVAPASRTDLEEKICISLGKIAAPETLPALQEISRPKGFFQVSKYPEKVRTAATRALVAIEAKQTEAHRG